MPTIQLSDDEMQTLNLALTNACDNFADEIAREERKTKSSLPRPRAILASMQRLKIKLNPSCLSGDWRLADGSVIRPGDYT